MVVVVLSTSFFTRGVQLLPPTHFGTVFGTVVVLRGIKSFTATDALHEFEVESELNAKAPAGDRMTTAMVAPRSVWRRRRIMLMVHTLTTNSRGL